MWIFPKTLGKPPLDILFSAVEKKNPPIFGKVIFRQSGLLRFFKKKWKAPHLPRWKVCGKSTLSPYLMKKRQNPIREDKFSKISKQ